MHYSPHQIEEVLQDVRQSYRLLHMYQRVVLDAAKYVGQELGLNYVGGEPLFSMVTPRPFKGDLGNWSWDWLNMFMYRFQFTKSLADGGLTPAN